MEIPKSLQEEIHCVQNKLKNAIQNHQVFVGKLNDDPNNQELLGQLHDIQEHIISLSKCQKQVVQRLRKEVKLYEAANSNGTKVSIASLLGLNNNNNITNNNETKTIESKQTINGESLNGLSRRSSKDDYEDGIQNLDIPSPANSCQNNCAKGRRNSNTVSDEEDVIEIAVTNNSNGRENDEICEIQLFDQLDFLGSLGLITSDKHIELQNKRSERKRRSTANPQFVYSNWEIPTKRKRHSYLQSNGTAPQTRQTTARLNGPSPPPNKVAIIKPSAPPPRAPIKSLIPTQKSSTRPNILRSNSESKLFTGKIKSENGLSQAQASLSAKSVQSVGSKAVHIPGLPSSLTIERIENDSSTVCINCRNPGSLTICEICAANFHVSCHVIASAPPRTCPKCVAKIREQDGSDTLVVACKEEDEIATTSNTSGNVGKTGKDSEVHKTTCGLHKIDAAEERPAPTAIDINQLPSSTFLIPIAPNSSSSSSSSSFSTICTSQSESIVSTSTSVGGESNFSVPYSSILLNQLSRSKSIKSDAKISYTYQVPVSSVQQEKPQSYLILKKISDSSANAGRNKPVCSSSLYGSQYEEPSSSSIFDYQQCSSTGYNDHDQSEIKSIPATQIADCSQLAFGQFAGKIRYNGQGFHGAEDTTSEQMYSGESVPKNKNFNGDKCLGKLRSKLSINKLRPAKESNSFIPLHSIINDRDNIEQFGISKQSENSGKVGKSKSNLLHPLFSSNNQPHSFPGGVSDPENSSSEQIKSEFDICSSEDKQEQDGPGPRPGTGTGTGTGSRLQSSSSKHIAEHVKLEEAHLPAPSRSNLVRKSIDAEIRAIGEKKGDFNSSMVEEFDDSYDGEVRDDDVKSRSDEGSQSIDGKDDDVNSDYTSFEDYHNENLKATLNFIAFERNHSSTYIKFHDFEGCGDLRNKHSMKIHREDNKNVSMTSCGVSESLQKSFSALINKQLFEPTEIKAEFERQDLPINEIELTENNKEGPTQDQSIALSQESKTKLGINAVSTENMQVLEQFESAMLEVDEDQTANC